MQFWQNFRFLPFAPVPPATKGTPQIACPKDTRRVTRLRAEDRHRGAIARGSTRHGATDPGALKCTGVSSEVDEASECCGSDQASIAAGPGVASFLQLELCEMVFGL